MVAKFVVGRRWTKVDRGTADETKQLWRGRRGRSTLALIFAILLEGQRLVSRVTQ